VKDCSNYLLEDSSSDGDIGGEWALLVDVLTLNGSLWGLETYTLIKHSHKNTLIMLTYRVRFSYSILGRRWSSWREPSWSSGRFQFAFGKLFRSIVKTKMG